MADILIGRAIGSTTGPDIEEISVSIDALTTSAYIAGDVLSAGAVAIALDCAARFAGQTVELVDVVCHEHAATGSCQKPDVSLYLCNADYAVPAQNAPFKGPTVAEGSPTSVLGRVTVPTAGWIEYEQTGAPPRAAINTVAVGKLFTTLGTRTLWFVPVVESAETFAADARLIFTFRFKR